MCLLNVDDESRAWLLLFNVCCAKVTQKKVKFPLRHLEYTPHFDSYQMRSIGACGIPLLIKNPPLKLINQPLRMEEFRRIMAYQQSHRWIPQIQRKRSWDLGTATNGWLTKNLLNLRLLLLNDNCNNGNVWHTYITCVSLHSPCKVGGGSHRQPRHVGTGSVIN